MFLVLGVDALSVQIYYSEDQTAEWIDFEKEAVLVATDMLMARASKNTSLWPGVRYWTSGLAKVQLQKTPGYLSDGTCLPIYSARLSSFSVDIVAVRGLYRVF